jgi:hypothetical protein
VSASLAVEVAHRRAERNAQTFNAAVMGLTEAQRIAFVFALVARLEGHVPVDVWRSRVEAARVQVTQATQR